MTEKNNSIIEIKSLTNVNNLCLYCHKYEANGLKFEEVEETVKKHLVLGYEVVVDGAIVGYAYSLGYGNIYTLDGNNCGGSIFLAARAGSFVVRDLFSKYTDVIYTAHKKTNKVLHALVRRIGFRYLADYEDFTIFEMRKSWE